MKRLALALCALVAAAAPALAQAPAGPPSPPKRLLTQALLDKIVAELPPLTRELEALGKDYDEALGGPDEEGDLHGEIQAALAALAADAKVKAILSRHGLNEGFWPAYGALFYGYSAVAMEAAAADAEKSQPGMGAMLADMVKQSKAWVHPEDFALVKKNRAKIEKLFEELDRND